MTLSTLDWVIVVGFLLLTLAIGVAVSRRAGKNTDEFFLSGRTMPWWLLGMSMVATTFSTDTPNLVTDIVRQNGVAGNWSWWAFLLTGMLTVFVYAKLWRRSGVMTDIEFYELRYSGKSAAFLRGFRALYLGLVFNVMAMSGVCLAAMKIGEVMFGMGSLQTILIASIVTVIFSSLGGFRGVVLTDCVLFVTALIGATAAAYYALGHESVGGLAGLVSNDSLQHSFKILPDASNKALFVEALVIPLSVQWWASWYPGAEPGGGGYIAQRMLAAKSAKHAVGATLFFNVAHYALRPWPWIIVALCSMMVFPLDSPSERVAAESALKSAPLNAQVKDWANDPALVSPEVRQQIETLKIKARGLSTLRKAYQDVNFDKFGHDLAYPAMLTTLPSGWLGIVVASLVAAYMSTISTHLNWGASYAVHDFYKRFARPEATEKEQVWAGRAFTVLLMVLSAALALALTNAKQLFDIIIMFGAGTGLVFLLRWFWWRINAWTEIAGMVASGLTSLAVTFGSVNGETLGDTFGIWKFPFVVAATTVVWLLVTWLTPTTEMAVLKNFYAKTHPGGPGWQPVIEALSEDSDGLPQGSAGLGAGIVCMLLGCVMVYSALFASGFWLYGRYTWAAGSTLVVVLAGMAIAALWQSMSIEGDEMV
ncbi:sodium:solute symporter family protein [Bythopirellula polymerisocia]|uniref:Sodium/glucose cotransporter n=1 Tax=Bythopirellula polymerisocia TaxID=2528003 RepID=A0A5C6C9B8_9BACT|nr:sodium:solute symporter family protein [Bythopirellula polymerisocia]TWU20748.1 Sodium/glucose cotransporter [Bythopirellula polymerisocia]